MEFFPGSSSLNPVQTPTPTVNTVDEEVHVKIMHPTGDPNDPWDDGFGLQSNNVRIKVQFKRSLPFSTWQEENFYFKSNVVEPGKAVVQGTNDLFFCSANEIKTVTLSSFP